MLMNAENYQAKVEEAVGWIRERLRAAGPQLTVEPRIGLVLGSGLNGLIRALPGALRLPYAQIPHFPRSTVSGHAGELALGRLNGVAAAVMVGRVHHYEGYALEQVVFPVRVLARLGIRALLLTNAAGGIRPEWGQGRLVLLRDHINLLGNPLIGPNLQGWGERFFDMSEAYDAELRRRARSVAERLRIPLEEGVYLAVTGPSYETPAEIRAFRALGADLVGMSTVPEVIAARHLGIRVLAISVVTNPAAGVQPAPINHAEVLATGARIEAQLESLLLALAPELEAAALGLASKE